MRVETATKVETPDAKDKFEALRLLLQYEQLKNVSYEDARDVGTALIEFYLTLATGGSDEQPS